MKNVRKIETIKRLVAAPRKEPVNIDIPPEKGFYHKETGTLILLNKYLDEFTNEGIALKIVVTSLEAAQALIEIIEEN